MTATRGKSGGYSLARPAAEINLVDAMRALDGPILEMPCAGPDNLEACSRPQDCSVHDVFERVHDSLAVALAGTNLAEAAMAAGGPPYPMAVRRQRRLTTCPRSNTTSHERRSWRSATWRSASRARRS